MSFLFDDTPGDGTCCLCENSYTYNGMARHVKKCAADHLDSDGAPEWLHIRLRAHDITRDPLRWQHVLANPAASLHQLDTHLREAWFGGSEGLGCFDITRTIYASAPAQLANPRYPVEPMTPNLGDVLRRGTELSYMYEVKNFRRFGKAKIYGHLRRPRLHCEDASPTPEIVTLARS
ncbi:MAG: hypothetical protein ACLFVJ_14590 [Persicimonas sp.]